MGKRLEPASQPLKTLTLCQLEDRFALAMPADLFRKASRQANSHDRIFTQGRTFWCFLWQCLTPLSSCRKVALQIQALFELHDEGDVSENDAAYCRARKRLPTKGLQNGLSASAREADRRAPASDLLRGRPLKVVDGGMVNLPDTPANRRKFPKSKCQQMNSGFPLMRLVQGSLYPKGFRVKQVTLVTTLLDPVLYPKEEILRA